MSSNLGGTLPVQSLGGSTGCPQNGFYHLDSFTDGVFDGVHTTETFVHATDAQAVLRNFFRVLRPGGHIAMFEYDHELADGPKEGVAPSMKKINDIAAMPTNSISQPGVFQTMLEDAGFTNVVVRDHSSNIQPMTRIFYLLGYVPFVVFTFLGLESFFINTVAGVETYRSRKHWRYVTISASKPGLDEMNKSR